ncbi:hypothetical protein K5I29_10415 [Flavobacterium agricola]|uniref:Methyltransferase n=1 Tax=Flavobacterium agricola TaxID=2870839 RepID=A0ABY6M0G8_9FLAO|nr:hypothetical protein [Flavobacterium agricola]UYW00910.1 hypothetical protein K5I29_10415 [Flavobacterium agricola]
MHKKFFLELKKPIRIIHFISPSDHRAFSDNSLSLQDFLQYSQEEWDKIQTKFDYHNRLRLPEYLNIFQKTGFEIEYLEFDNPKKDSFTYEKFKKIKLHDDYKDMSEEDLTAGSIIIILKKKNETI